MFKKSVIVLIYRCHELLELIITHHDLCGSWGEQSETWSLTALVGNYYLLPYSRLLGLGLFFSVS
jgi:hypothetical protein